MAERYNQEAQEYPLAPPSMARSDEEITRNHTNLESQNRTERRRRIRSLASMTLLASTLAAIALAIAIAIVFARVATPGVRLVDVELAAVPNSSDLRLSGRVAVRNRNRGRYEFDSALATVRTAADGTSVGQFVIHGGRTGARSTTRVYVIADLGGPLGPNEGGSDLRVEARLRGRVRVLGVLWRNRSARLNCTMTVGLPTNAVWNLRCR